MIDFEQVELSSFGRATTPHFYRANTFVAWCSGELGGIFATAPQRPHDIEPALALFQQMIRAGSTHDLLIDARRFGVDGLALSGAFHSVARVRVAMKQHCRRFCVVLPDDWSHAWWVGTIALCAPRPVRRHTVDDMNAATRWLDAAPTLVQSLDALAAKYGAPSLRGDVEERLRKDPTASIEQLARVLGLSPRSLQRALREAGSTFAALRSTVRAELAATMLTSTTSKMDRVASSIGFRSKSHFTAWFRRINGRSPAEFRRTTAAAASHATAR